MNLFKRIKHTPEIIAIKQGKPVNGIITAVSVTGAEYVIKTDGGEELRVPSSQCEIQD